LQTEDLANNIWYVSRMIGRESLQEVRINLLQKILISNGPLEIS